jgi:hypothetical protein
VTGVAEVQHVRRGVALCLEPVTVWRHVCLRPPRGPEERWERDGDRRGGSRRIRPYVDVGYGGGRSAHATAFGVGDWRDCAGSCGGAAARGARGSRVSCAHRTARATAIGAQFVTNTRYRRERSARLYRSYRSSTVHGTVVATVEGGAVETLVETVFCYHDGHGK